MTQQGDIDRRGIYNVEYFSGTSAAVYIGDVWVDEITGISYQVSQSRTPLYGYADTYFRDVSEGQVLVQGQFSINFKEAGYLFLVLNRYRQKMRGRNSVLQPFVQSDSVLEQNIERAYNGELTRKEKNDLYKDLAELVSTHNLGQPDYQIRQDFRDEIDARRNSAEYTSVVGTTQASLGGFASNQRAAGGIGAAENVFESFEDKAWRLSQAQLDSLTRRADDPRLNPFEIYVQFGDFAGDNSANHTIQKLSDVHIISAAKQILPNGMPIQETYTFMARNLV
jgi:hypothetical protein